MTPLARPASVAIQILRLPQVRARTGLCRTMIYQLEAEHQFPRRVKIGVRAVGWIEREVEEWLTQRVERSRSVPKGDMTRGRSAQIVGRERRGQCSTLFRQDRARQARVIKLGQPSNRFSPPVVDNT